MLRRTEIVAVLTGLALGGCGEDEAPVDPCGEPFYGGDGTDEAWRTMVDGEERARIGDADAPVVMVPSEGQVFSAGLVTPTFSWTSAIAAGPRSPSPLELGIRAESCESWVDELAELLIPKAHAHLPPITGDVYYLQIRVPGRECPYRVLTTQLDWGVDDNAWELLEQTAGQPITLDIMSAYLTENRITEGPYKPGASITFTVEP